MDVMRPVDDICNALSSLSSNDDHSDLSISRSFPSVSPSSSSSDSESDQETASPAAILSMAISKRRAIMAQPKQDLRAELLHASVVRKVCKFIGESGVQQRRKRKRSTKHHGSALCVRETCFTRECSDNTQQHTVSSDGINRECQNWASNAECYDESQNNFVQSRAAFAVNDCCEEPPYKRMCPVSSSPNADTGPDPVELDDLFAEVFGDSILDSRSSSKYSNGTVAAEAS